MICIFLYWSHNIRKCIYSKNICCFPFLQEPMLQEKTMKHQGVRCAWVSKNPPKAKSKVVYRSQAIFFSLFFFTITVSPKECLFSSQKQFSRSSNQKLFLPTGPFYLRSAKRPALARWLVPVQNRSSRHALFWWCLIIISAALSLSFQASLCDVPTTAVQLEIWRRGRDPAEGKRKERRVQLKKIQEATE